MLHGPQTLRGSGRWGGPAGGRAPSGHLGLALGRRGDFVVASIKRVSGRSHARLRIAALLAGVSLSAVAAHATDGTWVGGGPPFPTEWTQGNNWNSATVPDNTATFTNNSAPASVDNLEPGHD